MKYFIISLSILVLSITNILAQDYKKANAFDSKMEMLKEELVLSDDQYEQLKELYEQRSKDKANGIKSDRQSYKTALMEILSAEQYAKFTTLNREKRKNYNNGSSNEKQSLLAEKRAELDTHISAEDKLIIDEIRKDILKVKSENTKKNSQYSEISEAQKNQVFQLVDKYDAEISQIFESIKELYPSSKAKSKKGKRHLESGENQNNIDSRKKVRFLLLEPAK